MRASKLDPVKLGVAAGILWGLSLMLMTWISVYTGGYAQGFLDIIMGIYPGYTISLMGGFVGLAYGFVDAMVGFALIAYIYNKLL